MARGIGDAPANTWVMLPLQVPHVFSLHRLYTGLLLPKSFRTITNLPYAYQHTLSNVKCSHFGIKHSSEPKYLQCAASPRTHSKRLLEQAAPSTGGSVLSLFKSTFWGEFLQFPKCLYSLLPFLPLTAPALTGQSSGMPGCGGHQKIPVGKTHKRERENKH